jgi:hypothetical protein
VRDGDRVRVGVRLTVAVAVGTGWSPMRMMMESRSPTFPSSSRMRANTVVSPSGKLCSALGRKQNCTRRDAGDTKVASPKASMVHAVARLAFARNSHPISLSASATSWFKEKSGGLKPGMPRLVQTNRSPSPSGKETWTCRSGLRSGSSELELKIVFPTEASLRPGTASMTT